MYQNPLSVKTSNRCWMSLEFGRKSGFPYNLLRYIEQHHAEIASQFTDLPDLLPQKLVNSCCLIFRARQDNASLVQRIEEALKLLVEDRNLCVHASINSSAVSISWRTRRAIKTLTAICASYFRTAGADGAGQSNQQ